MILNVFLNIHHFTFHFRRKVVKKERRDTVDHGEAGPPPVPTHGRTDPDHEEGDILKSRDQNWGGWCSLK